MTADTSSSPPVSTSRRARLGPAIIALVTLAAVLLSGQRGLFGLQLAEAPGLTLDEGFNVAMGVYLVRSLQQDGLASLHPDTIREVYGSPNYNPDHPPFGRWALGFMHEFLGAERNVPFSDFAARPASGFAFALTVLLVGCFIQKWYGSFAGCLSSAAVALLPRQFAHAHLASLETFIGLTYAACVLVTADRCRPRPDRGGYGAFALAGIFFGLALLTKIQAVFLGPAIGLWALTQWRLRAVPRMAVFGGVGLVVFFVGWPWLWLDPVGHFTEYFARTIERQTLYCYYWGQRWADRDVPWHYPWVMLAVTVPIAIQLLAVWSALKGGRGWTERSEGSPGVSTPIRPDVNQASGRCQPADGVTREGEHQGDPESTPTPRSPRIDSRIQLLLWSIAIPLVVFTLPGIRVYDGERLFGVVFPLWAALAGIGAETIRQQFASSRARLVGGILVATIALQAYGSITLNPCQLSYYNLLTGGLAGADRLGFERTYWMEQLTDSFQREIVAKVPRGSRIDVAPVLHPVYLPHLLSQSPILQEADITLAPYDDKQTGGSRYVLHFHRKADPWASLEPPPEGTQVLAELKRQGVPLATLYELPIGERGASAQYR